MEHNEVVMANEYMADCKLKFILNTKYRNGQIAQGFTPACYFQYKIEFDEETHSAVLQKRRDIQCHRCCAFGAFVRERRWS